MKLFLTITLTAAGFVASAPAAGKGDAQAGKAVFLASCKTCHGSQGEGNPAIAKALKVTIPPLGSTEVQSKSDEALKKAIADGSGKMKPVPGLSGRQIQDVIAFSRSLGKP
ncbi:MAG: cytochrome c [Acidobacteriota bacterium]